MRGKKTEDMKAPDRYENLWKDAFEGAELFPSDKVWTGISKSLEQGSDTNGWLTILLVAASVTLAMAFPTTIGDSMLPVNDLYGAKFSEENFDNKSILDITTDSNETNESQQQAVNLIAEEVLEKLTESVRSVKDEMNTIAPTNHAATLFAYNYTVSVKRVYLTEQSISPGTTELPYHLAGLNYGLLRKSNDRSDLVAFQVGGGNGKAGKSFGGQSFANGAEDFASNVGAVNMDLPIGESDRQIFQIGAGLELPMAGRSALQISVNYLNSSADGTSHKLLLSTSSKYPLAFNDVVDQGLVTTGETYDYAVIDHFVSFPIVYKYAFMQRDFIIRAGVGTGLDLLLSHQVKSSDYGDNGYKASDVGLSPLWISLIGNIELGYWLAPNYLMSLEAGYSTSYGLIGNLLNNDNNRGGYSVGLKINYRLK